jgi:hypothetical protein
VQRPWLRINKLHDEKQKKIVRSKPKKYFSQTLKQIKCEQDEEVRDNYWTADNLEEKFCGRGKNKNLCNAFLYISVYKSLFVHKFEYLVQRKTLIF